MDAPAPPHASSAADPWGASSGGGAAAAAWLSADEEALLDRLRVLVSQVDEFRRMACAGGSVGARAGKVLTLLTDGRTEELLEHLASAARGGGGFAADATLLDLTPRLVSAARELTATFLPLEPLCGEYHGFCVEEGSVQAATLHAHTRTSGHVSLFRQTLRRTHVSTTQVDATVRIDGDARDFTVLKGVRRTTHVTAAGATTTAQDYLGPASCRTYGFSRPSLETVHLPSDVLEAVGGCDARALCLSNAGNVRLACHHDGGVDYEWLRRSAAGFQPRRTRGCRARQLVDAARVCDVVEVFRARPLLVPATAAAGSGEGEGLAVSYKTYRCLTPGEEGCIGSGSRTVRSFTARCIEYSIGPAGMLVDEYDVNTSVDWDAADDPYASGGRGGDRQQQRRRRRPVSPLRSGGVLPSEAAEAHHHHDQAYGAPASPCLSSRPPAPASPPLPPAPPPPPSPAQRDLLPRGVSRSGSRSPVRTPARPSTPQLVPCRANAPLRSPPRTPPRAPSPATVAPAAALRPTPEEVWAARDAAARPADVFFLPDDGGAAALPPRRLPQLLPSAELRRQRQPCVSPPPEAPLRVPEERHTHPPSSSRPLLVRSQQGPLPSSRPPSPKLTYERSVSVQSYAPTAEMIPMHQQHQPAQEEQPQPRNRSPPRSKSPPLDFLRVADAPPLVPLEAASPSVEANPEWRGGWGSAVDTRALLADARWGAGKGRAGLFSRQAFCLLRAVFPAPEPRHSRVRRGWGVPPPQGSAWPLHMPCDVLLRVAQCLAPADLRAAAEVDVCWRAVVLSAAKRSHRDAAQPPGVQQRSSATGRDAVRSYLQAKPRYLSPDY